MYILGMWIACVAVDPITTTKPPADDSGDSGYSVDPGGPAVSAPPPPEANCSVDVFLSDGAVNTFQYDGKGRIISEVYSTKEGGIRRVFNDYDDDRGNLTGRRYPDDGYSEVYTFGYDEDTGLLYRWSKDKKSSDGYDDGVLDEMILYSNDRVGQRQGPYYVNEHFAYTLHEGFEGDRLLHRDWSPDNDGVEIYAEDYDYLEGNLSYRSLSHQYRVDTTLVIEQTTEQWFYVWTEKDVLAKDRYDFCNGQCGPNKENLLRECSYAFNEAGLTTEETCVEPVRPGSQETRLVSHLYVLYDSQNRVVARRFPDGIGDEDWDWRCPE